MVVQPRGGGTAPVAPRPPRLVRLSRFDLRLTERGPARERQRRPDTAHLPCPYHSEDHRPPETAHGRPAARPPPRGRPPRTRRAAGGTRAGRRGAEPDARTHRPRVPDVRGARPPRRAVEGPHARRQTAPGAP